MSKQCWGFFSFKKEENHDHDLTGVSSIVYPDICRIIEQRFVQIFAGEVYNYDQDGYMIAVEPGDSVDTLEKESGCPILRDLFGDACSGNDESCFGNPDCE